MNTNKISKSRKQGNIYYDAFYRLIKDKLAVISFIIITIFVFISILVPLIEEIYPNFFDEIVGESYESPTKNHIFGTDIMGRDILRRLLAGTKISMEVGLKTSLIYIPIGVILGALAGFLGGIIDDIIQWIYQTIASIPDLLLLIALTFILGRGLNSVCIAIGITSWVGLCRLIRAEFIKHKEREYVISAKSLGASNFRCIFHHILPNIIHIVIISFSLRFILAISIEVILTYVGVGVEPGIPSWGRMIADARNELAREPSVWWPLLGATLMLFLISLAFNYFSDSLRDVFDPKLKNETI